MFNEMTGADGAVRAPYADYQRWFDAQDAGAMAVKAKDAETIFRRTGITFAVYGEAEADRAAEAGSIPLADQRPPHW